MLKPVLCVFVLNKKIFCKPAYGGGGGGESNLLNTFELVCERVNTNLFIFDSKYMHSCPCLMFNVYVLLCVFSLLICRVCNIFLIQMNIIIVNNVDDYVRMFCNYLNWMTDI